MLGWVLAILLILFGGNISFFLPRKDWTFVWYLFTDGWVTKLLRKRYYKGFSIGNNAFVVPDELDDAVDMRTIDHERTHCRQQFKFGIFFPILYILESLRIFFFVKDAHSYYDNCFEVEARKNAGQMVKIPRSLWIHGPEDRWIWW